jgi:phage gpG-like protein
MEVSSNNGGGYPDVKITVDGCEELAAALKKVSEVRFHGAAKIAAQNIYNRAVNGGTPVDTGELRRSAGVDVQGEDKAVMGYGIHYAPHVEFGHRTRGGGYVQGQHFLQRNVEQEKDAFKKLLADELKKVL